MKDDVSACAPEPRSGRYWQLAGGMVAMASISAPQYAWTLFTKPLLETTGGTLAELQWTFSLLIVLQNWLSPFQGMLIERYGSRRLVMLGCALSGCSWIAAAYARSVSQVYLTYGLMGGIGIGMVYLGVVGYAVRRFPDRRGFAIGMTAAAYGFGALLLNFPIARMLGDSGLQKTLITFGILQGLTGICASTLLAPLNTSPRAAAPEAPSSDVSSCSARDMLGMPIFWLLFIMMTMMSTGGLMVISQFATFSRSFGIDEKVIVFGFSALPFALTLDRITNGLTRPIFGIVSDRLGRENTMAIAFIGEAAAVLAMLLGRHDPTLYVLMSGVVFFGWGEVYSLFPAILIDIFGEREVTRKLGFLYFAPGVASVLGGPVAAMIYHSQSSWLPVFALVILMDVATGLLSLLAIKPMRRRHRVAASRA